MSSIAELYFVSSSMAQIIIYLLTAIFLLALIAVIRGIARYYFFETAELNLVKQNWRNLRPGNNSLDAVYNDLKWKGASSYIQERLYRMYFIARHQQPIEYNNLVSTTYQKDEALFENKFLAYASTALLLLGLFGTFYGLSMLVSDLQGIFYNVDTSTVRSLLETYERATENMRLTLFPLRDAFSTSFWGIFFMLLLRALLLPFNWARQRYFADLESFSVSHLVPIFSPMREEQELMQLIQEVTQTSSKITHISESLDIIIEKLQTDFEGLGQASSNLHTSIVTYNSGQEMLHKNILQLTDLVQRYTAKVENSDAENYKVIEALNLHNVTLSDISKKLYEKEFNTNDWLREIINYTKDQQTHFNETLKNLLALTRSNLSNTQSAANRFDSGVRKFKDSLEKLQNHLTYFNSAIENTSDREVHKLDQIAQQLQSMNQLLTRMYGEMSANMEGLAQNIRITQPRQTPVRSQVPPQSQNYNYPATHINEPLPEELDDEDLMAALDETMFPEEELDFNSLKNQPPPKPKQEEPKKQESKLSRAFRNLLKSDK